MIDVNGATWRAINDNLTKRLAMLREKNDKHLPESETAKLRGQIEEVKKLLRLPEALTDPAIMDQPIE